MHPLVTLILSRAAELHALEGTPKRLTRASRTEIAERSRYLSGLLDAARLTLGAADLSSIDHLL